jgi:protein-L-isoaspartate(D-aspartate) O-methyltransferase
LKARILLRSLGYRNVSLLVGDGTLGWEEHSPYDAVVISAAAPCIPRPLVEQLKVPGYLVFPMGEEELKIWCGFVKTEQEFEKNIWATVTS